MTLIHYFFDLTSFCRLGHKCKNIFVNFLVQMNSPRAVLQSYCIKDSRLVIHCAAFETESIFSLVKNGLVTTYRKVASSRPVYYSIFDYFWGATNWDVLLTETCYYCLLVLQQSNNHNCIKNVALINFNLCIVDGM